MGKNEFLISQPNIYQKKSRGENRKQRVGYYEIIGKRPKLEDGLLWKTLPPTALSPTQIGYRLWTSIKLLDKKFLRSYPYITAGSTLSITYYDGKSHFVTLTVGDTEALIAAYGPDNTLLGVIPLNSLIHHPDEPSEEKRLKALGITVSEGRIYGISSTLGVSRAVGDRNYKCAKDPSQDVVIADAQMDVHNLDSIAAKLGVPKTSIATVKVFTFCDGYFDACPKGISHSDYLYKDLASFGLHVDCSEEDLACKLATKTSEKQDRGGDNISVLVKTLSLDGKPAKHPEIYGVFDGHGGNQATHFIVDNFLAILAHQYTRSEIEYASQKLSVYKNQKSFRRDNAKYFTPLVSHHGVSNAIHASQPEEKDRGNLQIIFLRYGAQCRVRFIIDNEKWINFKLNRETFSPVNVRENLEQKFKQCGVILQDKAAVAASLTEIFPNASIVARPSTLIIQFTHLPIRDIYRVIAEWERATFILSSKERAIATKRMPQDNNVTGFNQDVEVFNQQGRKINLYLGIMPPKTVFFIANDTYYRAQVSETDNTASFIEMYLRKSRTKIIALQQFDHLSDFANFDKEKVCVYQFSDVAQDRVQQTLIAWANNYQARWQDWVEPEEQDAIIFKHQVILQNKIEVTVPTIAVEEIKQNTALTSRFFPRENSGKQVVAGVASGTLTFS